MPAAIPALLLALSFHEYAHARVATLLGDPTPQRQGRLTLNPIAHLDPLGTLLLVVAGFGWAKPVEINPFYFRSHRRQAVALVGVAGPAMNLAVGYLAAVALVALDSGGYLFRLLYWLLLYNTLLAVFNFLPVPPLDGSKVLAGVLPYNLSRFVYQMESYGPFVLLVLVATGAIRRVLYPLVEALIRVFLHTAGTTVF
jgi:Zn-dependent protease